MIKSFEFIFVIYYRHQFHISKERTIQYKEIEEFFFQVFSVWLLQIWRKLWRATHEIKMPNPKLHTEFMHEKTPTCLILLPGLEELQIFGVLLL